MTIRQAQPGKLPHSLDAKGPGLDLIAQKKNVLGERVADTDLLNGPSCAAISRLDL